METKENSAVKGIDPLSSSIKLTAPSPPTPSTSPDNGMSALSKKLVSDGLSIGQRKGIINSASKEELGQMLIDLKISHTRKGKKATLVNRLKNFIDRRFVMDLPEHARDKVLRNNATDADYICVVDFEATCEEAEKGFPHEIIEFPLVFVDVKELKVVHKVQYYCQPTVNPVLSEFCTNFTGITQEQVDAADTFPVVLENVLNDIKEFRESHPGEFIMACDGPWDFRDFFQWQCAACDIEPPKLMEIWLDIRKAFKKTYKKVKKTNVTTMLAHFGLEFEGSQHSGLDDSVNIANILIHLLDDGLQPIVNARYKTAEAQPRLIEKRPNLQRK